MKKRILSGVTSTGKLTLGNYLGAISNFVKLQKDAELIVFIANLHALTSPINPQYLQENTIDIAAWYFACGIDENKATVFIQSDVLEHAQLSYILLCHTGLGELERMTQFKDKSFKQQNKTASIPSGLLFYPTLMAADILLYDADQVPVGSDQTQHLELTRELAKKINSKYKTLLFKTPEQYSNPFAHKIRSLQEPHKKMSKSDDNPNNIIFLSDDAQTITNKIKKAVTDSEGIIKYDIDNKPGVSNLLAIYASIKNQTIAETQNYFQTKNYGQLKAEVSQVIIDLLTPIQIRHQEILNNKQELLQGLHKGALKAQKIASSKLQSIQDVIGINCDKLK